MNLSLKAIIKREYFSYVNSPIAYIITPLFLAIISFLYYRSALVVGDANLRPFIELIPWFLIVIAPAFTMKAFSRDDRSDPMELMFAHPASEWIIVFGKFIGATLFYATMLGGTILLPLTLVLFSTPDIGTIVAQYLGALLTGMAFLSVSLAVASYVGSSIGSFLAATFLNLIIVLLGMDFVVLMAPGVAGRFISELSITPHLTNLSRGVIDLRDILYFATIIGIALTATVLKLSERKVQEDLKEKSKLRFTLLLIVGIGIVGNLFMAEYPFRIDATRSRQFSVSKGAKQLLNELPDRINIDLYASSNLPGPLQAILRDTSDRLKDLTRYSDKVTVTSTVITPGDENARNEAIEAGMREVQFNQIGAGSFQVQTGFLGLKIRYADQTDTIDFIEDSSNLEYQIARSLVSLTRDEKPKIGLIDTTDGQQTSLITGAMQEQYELTIISDDADEEQDLSQLNGVVVIDDAASENATSAAKLANYLDAQGNAVFFIDGVNVNQQILTVTPTNSAFKELLIQRGITINQDIVYDLQLNQAIPFGEGAETYILPYPFWPRPVVVADNIPWSSSQSNVLLAWASTIELNQDVPFKANPLLVTSEASNRQSSNFALQPDDLKTLTPPAGESQIIGAIASNETQHLAVIADANIVSDNFLGNVPENAGFISNLIDWVAADEILQAIPQRNSGRNIFVFASQLQVAIVQWANLLIPPIATAGFGIWWLARRKKLSRRKYK